jgi:gamma-glutamyltranspeptidase / glutathione hydrolase
MKSTTNSITRRKMLGSTAGTLAGGILVPNILSGESQTGSAFGYVIGDRGTDHIGAKVLANGGNAFDAIVTTALAGAISQPHQTGIGGFAAFGIFAYDGGQKIIALDANSTAPAGMTADVFKRDAQGKVIDDANNHGWLASGVPGLIGGLHLIVTKLGTRPFSEALRPAIRLLREGFPFPGGSLVANAKQMMKDPGTRKLYFPDGKPLATGSLHRNPDLAALLETLAQANSVEPFYRGDIARRIAEAFAKNGGLVTLKDLADYQPRLIEPLSLKWGDRTIHTCPLTSGGLSVFQTLAVLRAMDFEKLPAGVQRMHTQIEAMRLAWHDRLTLLGDPNFVKIPAEKLLSDDYAHECAERVQAAVKQGQFISHAVTPKEHGGTLSFSAVDRHGNMAALTVTHGNSYGAQVTVDGLGLTLGHGISRFDSQPGHPNGVAPGKKPLINMVPTLITRGEKATLAVGGRGGRRIPNSVLEFLIESLFRNQSLDNSMKAPRLHTEGTINLERNVAWPEEEAAALQKIGYKVKVAGAATLSAVAIESGEMRAAMQ